MTIEQVRQKILDQLEQCLSWSGKHKDIRALAYAYGVLADADYRERSYQERNRLPLESGAAIR